MSTVSSDWKVQLPDSSGATFCLRPLDCAELDTVQHGTMWQSFGKVGFDGQPYEIARYTQYNPNSGNLLLTEQQWDLFNRLSNGCTVNIHRTHCTDKWVEIFTDVTPMPVTRRNLVSGGLLGKADLPSVQVPFLFNKLHRLEVGLGYLISDSPNQMEHTIVGVAFCDCKSCCNQSCSDIYKLNESGQLFVSHDFGTTWVEIYNCLPDSGTGLVCINGNLFVPSLTGLYWSEPDFTGVWNHVLKTYIIKSVISVGSVIYTLGYKAGRHYVLKSIDGGYRWSNVYDAEYIDYITATLSTLYIAVGSVLRTIKDDVIIEYTFDNPIVAITSIRSSELNLYCSDIVFVALDNNVIYKGHGKSWRRILHGEKLSNGETATLKTLYGGSVVYYHRIIDGTPMVMISYDCCTWHKYPLRTNVGELCSQIATVNDTIWGCIDEDGNITQVYRVPCVEVPDVFDCNDTLWGCWEGENVTLFTFDGCGTDECVRTFIGDKGRCELCDCVQCICTTCEPEHCRLYYTEQFYVNGIFGPCTTSGLTPCTESSNACGDSGCFEIDDSVYTNSTFMYGYINETGVYLWGCENIVITEITLPQEQIPVDRTIIDIDFIALLGVDGCCDTDCPPSQQATCGIHSVFDVCSNGVFVALASEALVNL